MGYCKCCERSDAIFPAPRSFNGLPTARLVCGLCEKHQSSHPDVLRKRDRAHKEMWIVSKDEAIEALTEQHNEEVARLTSRIADLESELSERPFQVVVENLDAATVAEAHDMAEGAYRTRDTAFKRLTLVHMLHFESRAGFCRCGKPVDDCEINELVDNYRALKNWEHVNATRRKQGLTHALPRDHPGIIDARWDPDPDEAREFEQYSR